MKAHSQNQLREETETVHQLDQLSNEGNIMQCLRFDHILSHNEKQTLRRNNMKKAILVNDYESVKALNKLLEEGYTVESVDKRGVYILTKEGNIKKKHQH